MASVQQKRLLLLSVGYGQGHHSAAAAMADVYSAEGWDCRMVDICAVARPFLFGLTQRFYGFCVRRAPWLWGITYSLTDTADWARMVQRPIFRHVLACALDVLQEWNPDLIICTYPLFAYILDELRERGEKVPPYAVVVTDAREISRPWMLTQARLVLVPDAGSRQMVLDRYALPARVVHAAGFPVKRAFAPSLTRQRPSREMLKILYGAYRQTQGVVNDIAAILTAFPAVQLTVLAGPRMRMLQRFFSEACSSGRLKVLRETDIMHELLAESHFYVGKAGAATMFECYASHVPVLVNFTLPGQERGNLELLLEDGAGCHVESTADLIATLQRLLDNDAAAWEGLCIAMQQAGRAGGAPAIAAIIQNEYAL